jgi:hypothetical protein
MKLHRILIILIVCSLNYTCDDLGGIEEHHPIPSSSKFLLKVNDTLTFQCGSRIEKFDIPILVNGKYYEYRSGTCMKGALDLIDFQAIFIKPVDSLAIAVGIGTDVYDCDGPPQVNNYYISIIKNLVNTFHSQGIEYDADLCWNKDFHVLESSFTMYYKSIILNDRQYKDVFAYEVPISSTSSIETLYYTKHYGFIGYKLRNGDLYNLIKPII